MRGYISLRRERLAGLVAAKASCLDSKERHKVWMFMKYRKYRRMILGFHYLSRIRTQIVAEGLCLGVLILVISPDLEGALVAVGAALAWMHLDRIPGIKWIRE